MAVVADPRSIAFLDGTGGSSPGAGGGPKINTDTKLWLAIRAIYRYQLKAAFDVAALAPSATDPSAAGAAAAAQTETIAELTAAAEALQAQADADGTAESQLIAAEAAAEAAMAKQAPKVCVPAVGAKRCAVGNAAFLPLPDDSPEYETTVEDPKTGLGEAWPPSPALYAAISAAFSAANAAASTIPLQLQLNTLEGYRKTLLHKKWRRCHHLVAMAKNLKPEVQAEDELQLLLLGQQIGQETAG